MPKYMTQPSPALLRIIAKAGIKDMNIVAPNVAVGYASNGREIVLHGPAMGKYEAHNAQQLRKADKP